MTASRPMGEARPDVLERDVAALAAVEHDVLVIGGGIYGVTAAFEAARHGLRTALVEADDFGGGASWNSLKTIHGGLRHLQRLDLASHRESVRERCLLLRLAPAVVRPLPFLVPAYGHGPKGREALRLGLLLDDLLAVGRNRGLGSEQRLRAGLMLSRAETMARVPGLRTEGLTGAALWEDAQVESSERLTVAFLRAAAGAGARSANHCEAVSLLRTGNRVTGARVRDRESGLELRRRSADGPECGGSGRRACCSHRWAQRRSDRCCRPRTSCSKGPGRSRLDSRWAHEAGNATSSSSPGATASSRARRTGPRRDTAAPTRSGRSGRRSRQAFPWAGLQGRRLVLVHRGLVPGEAGPDGLATRSRFDDHATCGGPAGVLTIRGVKYTTARAVAERAVRRALGEMGLRGRASAPHEPLAWARPLDGLAGRAHPRVPCGKRWRVPSPMRSCAASISAPRGLRRTPSFMKWPA